MTWQRRATWPTRARAREECGARLVELGLLDEDGVTAVKAQARKTALEHRNKVLGMPLPEPSGEEERVYAP